MKRRFLSVGGRTKEKNIYINPYVLGAVHRARRPQCVRLFSLEMAATVHNDLSTTRGSAFSTDVCIPQPAVFVGWKFQKKKTYLGQGGALLHIHFHLDINEADVSRGTHPKIAVIKIVDRSSTVMRWSSSTCATHHYDGVPLRENFVTQPGFLPNCLDGSYYQLPSDL